MKIIVAPDSFKDSLRASKVAEHIKTGLLQSIPNALIHCLPLADGGEGTVEAMVEATGGELITANVIDPIGRDIKAKFGLTGDKTTAIIEMAAASGIELLSEEERNPWVTTTYGTGQLMLKALEHGCTKIILGIGGSATNDGGAGMFQALGGKLLTVNNKEIEFGGGALGNIDKIDTSELTPLLKNCTIVAACDVNNPLVGRNGASYVYGPQKGAGEEMVKLLDANLTHYAKKINEQLGKEIAQLPGAGAAGGLGAGLYAFLNAELTNGFKLITDIIHLDSHIAKADLVITGEGKIDFQTQYGKVQHGVAQIAKKYNVPVIAIAGTIGKQIEELYSKGIDAVFSIVNSPMELQEALEKAPELLEECARNIGKLISFQVGIKS